MLLQLSSLLIPFFVIVVVDSFLRNRFLSVSPTEFLFSSSMILLLPRPVLRQWTELRPEVGAPAAEVASRGWALGGQPLLLYL